ncbi:hypothetical protein ACQUQU_04065 [Thalassolituus sp. LLYu03]|uniref:hypothetical protein n=1 Tax=Thalassolituus sp. LLYu03 TaxID=3421656 RepID=UPI003D2A415C
MFPLRRAASAACATALLLLTSPLSQAEGGFVAVQAGITDSQDMDRFENTFKVHFGPNITKRLSLEFGLMDMGKVSYRDPQPDFTDVSDDTAPTFKHAEHGSVSRTSATDTDPSVATFTGFSSAHPQSVLITFRYRIPLRDDLDFFLKTGANIWWADYELVEINAYQDETVTRSVTKRGQTSAVDQITGGGFLWNVASGLSIRAELETSALDSRDFERARFQLVTLGAQYEF